MLPAVAALSGTPGWTLFASVGLLLGRALPSVDGGFGEVVLVEEVEYLEPELAVGAVRTALAWR